LLDFDIIITDEASQIPEFQLAGLLTRAKKFILIGDEKQLPAIINQSPQYYHIENELLAAICMTNLSISLFDRLLRVCKLNAWDRAYDTLIFQARMHEDIQKYPNMLFYNNSLQIFGLNQKEKIKHFSPNSSNPIERILAGKRFVFINCMHGLGFKESEIEAKMVLDICNTIKHAVKHQFNNDTIGVIAPYRVQCSLVKSFLNDEFGDMVNVDTVERYQGSQREFIIMSSATNYEQLLSSMSNLSYFDDIPIDRKLNVAMTRAKSHFIFIGNAKILQNSPIYSKLLQELREEQAFFESSDLM
jgi:DNA replication ATP-dependent helicase Dna2